MRAAVAVPVLLGTVSAQEWRLPGSGPQKKKYTQLPTQCDRKATDCSTCSQIQACEGNCHHPWCAVPGDNPGCNECGEQWNKCKWPNTECEARGGCLDYSQPLKECDENCRGPHCKVCLFTSKNILDETREVEAALMEANANYELIFDHPDYQGMKEPIVIPREPMYWHQRQCGVNDPTCHRPMACTDCEAHDMTGDDSSTYYFLNEEFRTCKEAHDAATRYSQAKYNEIHIPAVPMTDNDPLCTDHVDPDVAWEFGTNRYESCQAALRAAQAVEKADNPDYQCNA